MDALSINTLRLWVGSLVILLIVASSGRGADLIQPPLVPFVYMVVSGILAMAIGDSIYIKSLSLLDASIAFPIAQCSFPLMTVMIAALLLDEPFTWLNCVGAFLVVLGIYLIAVSGKKDDAHPQKANLSGKGVLLALAAAVAWTAAAVTLKIGVEDMDPFIAAGIRISSSAVLLSGLILVRSNGRSSGPTRFSLGSVLLAATAGVLTYGVAAVGYVAAIQLIGAGKTVPLTTTSPLFVLPFSILLLKEKPTGHAVAGIVLCVLGIVLVVS